MEGGTVKPSSEIGGCSPGRGADIRGIKELEETRGRNGAFGEYSIGEAVMRREGQGPSKEQSSGRVSGRIKGKGENAIGNRVAGHIEASETRGVGTG
jgi:hypothetical protein